MVLIISRCNKGILRVGVKVARRSLEAKIGVRIPDPQQFFAKATELPSNP